MLSATAFAQTDAEARALLSPLAEGQLAARCQSRAEYQESPFNLLFDWDAESFPWARWAADNLWTDAPVAEVATRLQEQYRMAASPRTTAICLLTRGPKKYPDAAFSMKGSAYVSCYANWDAAADDAENMRWVDDTMTAMQPFTKGHYINEANIAGHPEKAASSFSDTALQKIRRLRAQLDPDHVFFDVLAT